MMVNLSLIVGHIVGKTCVGVDKFVAFLIRRLGKYRCQNFEVRFVVGGDNVNLILEVVLED